MSSAVFPPLATTPGLSWNVRQTPQFNTLTQRSVNGRELRAALMAYPLWNIELTYDVLRDADYGSYTELETIVWFFLARQGAFDNFLWVNPNDKTASGSTNANMGTGNASNLTFQLARQRGAGGFTFNEPINNVTAVSTITFNGVTQNTANYTTGNTGLITFNSTTRPGNGVLVAWTGTYYYKCRFLQDAPDFDNFMRGLWELKSLSFVGSVVNKV